MSFERIPEPGLRRPRHRDQAVATGLPRLSADRERLRSLTAWPWIVSLILTAN